MSTPDTPISPRQSRTARLADPKLIVLVISRLFSVLFMYTAVMKIIGHEKFQLEMGKSPIITDYADILVWAVPAGEVILAALAYFEETMLIGLYGSLATMSLFTAYIYAILHFSDSIPCACMGVFEKMGFEDHLIFNIVFVVLAIIGIFLKDKIDKTRQSYSQNDIHANGSGKCRTPVEKSRH